MNYVIATTEDFERQLKHLRKKYTSLADDYAHFLEDLHKNPTMGDDLGDNTRKVRMAIASKNKGKRGGARVITYHILIDETKGKIYLLTIYDKGEQDSVSRNEIAKLKRDNGLI
jgi:mRNA-degrading endonuclease RelE of RelBE toxin-antitoxin system